MFVARQQTHVVGPIADRHRDYWQQRLAKAATITELPTDFSRPPIFTGRAAVVPLPLTAQLSHRLLTLAASQRVTPFTLLMAALQVLLSKYAQQTNFLIGTPFAARGQQAFEKTVGFFVNMLPIAADLEGDPSFDQILQRVAHTLDEAMEHEDYPLASIVRDLGPVRDPSRSPLFQVTCTFEKSQLRHSQGLAGLLFPQQPQPISFAGLQQETFYVPQTTCHHDLEFVLEHSEDLLGGMLIYCRDLFEEASAQALAAAFTTILEEVVEQPTRRLSQLLRNERTLPVCPRQMSTVVPAWTGAVERFADRPALRAGDRMMTYAELDYACQELSQQLTIRGVQPQAMVPILAERGATAWLAIWACLLHGRIPVPIDAAMPAVSIDTVLAETQATLVLTDSQERPQARQPQFSVPFLAVEPATTSRDALREPAVVPELHPEDLAYVIYTSGSTGRPKGVMIEHGSLVNTLTWRQETLPVDEHDRILLLLSHQFDASFGIVFAAWMVGAEVVIADEPTARDVDRLLERLIADDITILPCLPSWLPWIIAHPRFKDCRHLQQVWCGGEPLPSSLARQILESTSIRLWNFYGPTEAAIECAAWEVRDAEDHRPIPLGRPIRQTSLLVLDQQRQLQPRGVVGELAIIGPGVARGYLRQPELTAERFVPWRDASGQLHRAYLTGDFGRERSDGLLEFSGRRDTQIKFRGFRIELSEIEQALMVHPGVGQAVAWVEAAATAQARLTAAVEPAGNPTGEALNGERLRRFLSERLPAFKVPSWIEIVERFPRNASGKVDRPLLEKRIGAVLHPSGQHATTGNPLEDYLAELWQECLGIPQLQRDRDFFDLGGTSLQAARMTALLSQRLGVRVPTALVFDLADIRQMADRLLELYPRPLEERFGRRTMPADSSWLARDLATSDLGDPHPNLHPLLVPLQPLGQQPPLFLVHPPGGFVLCYRELSQHLAAGRPCYAIRARGLYADEGLPDSVEAMATEYVTAIRALQPQGPYAIGGWSLGGVIAFEVAQQLVQAGERVDVVFMLDSAIPENNFAEGASDGLRAGAEYGIPLTLEELSRLDEAQQLPFLWQHARQLGLLAADADEELAQRVIQDLKQLFAQHVELCSRYRLQSYPGRVVLIRPLDLPIAIPGPEDRGWDRYAAEVETYRTPGQHHSMVQSPHVQSLAAIIDSCLARLHPVSRPLEPSTESA
jgi:amino acid adenylation domain-containing protein